MPELNEEAKDTETDSAVPKPLTASRLAALCVAGLVGGAVGAAALGLVGAMIGAESVRGSIVETVGLHAWLSGSVGAVMGLPFGITMGLRAAGTKLGIRGRFWRTLASSSVAALAGIGLWLVSRPLQWARSADTCHLIATFPLILSLVGGLVGYLGGRPRRPDGRASDS